MQPMMTRPPPPIVALVLCAAAMAQAQPTAESAAKAPVARSWDAGTGLLLSLSPEYSGAEHHKVRARLALYVRWGRLSISNAGGFVDRRNEEVVRGLGLDLGHSPTFHASLGLRYDAGRSESSSAALAGIGDVRATVRARMAATWRPEPQWRLGAAWTVDAFGRGGGNLGEISALREGRWSADTSWTAGATLTFAGDRYLQTWYGVNAAQSQRSGLPVYEPGNGLRDLTLYASTRQRVASRWVLLVGASATRLLGPTLDSPLVTRPNSLAAQAGLHYEF
jgi:outer membrane scaffolding protein for murein synthesis (MipA/OmpV family)